MEQELLASIEVAGVLSPLFFITVHVIRPFMFLPVMIICMTGGIWFGAVEGTIYSVIGTVLSSMVFYLMIQLMPNSLQRLQQIKAKFFGRYVNMNVMQITLLRFLPFMHFHLLSLCLIDLSKDFKSYIRLSLISSVPFVIVYTLIGHYMVALSPMFIAIFMGILMVLLYVLRSREQQIKWQDFFQTSP